VILDAASPILYFQFLCVISNVILFRFTRICLHPLINPAILCRDF